MIPKGTQENARVVDLNCGNGHPLLWTHSDYAMNLAPLTAVPVEKSLDVKSEDGIVCFAGMMFVRNAILILSVR